MAGTGIVIKEDAFGIVPIPEGSVTPVRRFTITNMNPGGGQVQIINYGATITSLKVPDRTGKLDDVVLGYDQIEGYLGEYGRNPYLGATIGRVCNRIAKGQFNLNDDYGNDGNSYQLGVNNGLNHLHGGFVGFDKKMWEAEIVEGNKVVMSCVSNDGDEGYPGSVLANVTFELSKANELEIEFQATATKPTPIAMTNHSYFNLAGHGQTDQGLKGHYIRLNADYYTPVDDTLITSGKIMPVEKTKYDLRDAKKSLSELFEQYPEGYDHNFCVNKANDKDGYFGFGLAAIVQEKGSGRVLMVYSDQPGVQFYTANFLPNKKEGQDPIKGKEGAQYWKQGAFCLETQNYPNAVNHAHFPSAILRPGQVYKHKVSYRFFTTVAS